MLPEEAPDGAQICDMLYRLGINRNYTGFYYAAYGIWLCAREPARLQLVTKWLYPDVAARYGTNWKAVERSLRTVVDTAWRNNPALLETLAGKRLHEKPCSSLFLSILTAWLFPNEAA